MEETKMAVKSKKEKVSSYTKAQIHDMFEQYCIWKERVDELNKKLENFKKPLIEYVKDNGNWETDKMKKVVFDDGEIKGTSTDRAKYSVMVAKQILPENIYQAIMKEEIDGDKYKEAKRSGLIEEQQHEEIATITTSWSLSCQRYGK
jgi:hypothetical protein